MSQGKAVLFMQQADGQLSADEFLEEDHASPWHAAQGLRDACRDDFPNATWAIGHNERSQILMRNENMRRMGFSDTEYDADSLL